MIHRPVCVWAERNKCVEYWIPADFHGRVTTIYFNEEVRAGLLVLSLDKTINRWISRMQYCSRYLLTSTPRSFSSPLNFFLER